MQIKDFWDDRYAQSTYAYGKEPNDFLKQKLQTLKPGKILLPCEGEGRNAVYAASIGWMVDAFDISIAGQKKALMLAHEKGVSIDYQVQEVSQTNFPLESFDVIALVFAHFQPEFRKNYHHLLSKYLKKNGLLILEGFGVKQLETNQQNGTSNGPKNVEMLFTKEMILADFSHLTCEEISEQNTSIEEGLHHRGSSWVIRYIGRKTK